MQPIYTDATQVSNISTSQSTDNPTLQQPYVDPNTQQVYTNPNAQPQAQPATPIAPANPFEANYPNANFDQSTVSQDIVNLANNSDFSVETIAQQANRINNQSDNEVFVTLH